MYFLFNIVRKFLNCLLNDNLSTYLSKSLLFSFDCYVFVNEGLLIYLEFVPFFVMDDGIEPRFDLHLLQLLSLDKHRYLVLNAANCSQISVAPLVSEDLGLLPCSVYIYTVFCFFESLVLIHGSLIVIIFDDLFYLKTVLLGVWDGANKVVTACVR